jgi:hypothetical protein
MLNPARSAFLALVLLLASSPWGHQLAFGQASAAATKQRWCVPSGSRTIRSTNEVRIYRRGEEKFVCSLRTGRTKRLDSRDESTAYIYDVRGSYVAYEIYVTTRDRSYIAVRTVDARSARLVVNVDAFTGADRISQSVEAATGMRLVSGGQVAWISRSNVVDATREVRYASTGADARVLSTGTEIDPRSLAVAPGYVYWMNSGMAQNARIP